MNTKIRDPHPRTWLIVMLTAMLLAACGGGGGTTAGGNTTAGGGTIAGGTPPGSGAPDNSTPPGGAPGNSTPPPVAAPLTVSSSSPADSTTNVALNSAPSVTFNSKLANATIVSPATTFTVQESLSGNIIDGRVTVSTDGMTAIFTPTVSLTANTQYLGTVRTAVKNTDGNTLARDYTWTFTSGSPAVDFAYPAAAATAVAPNTKIAAAFTTDMDPVTIVSPATSFTVKSATGAAIAGTVIYDTKSRTAVFTPAADLQPDTQYTVTLTTNVKDASTVGSPLASNKEWNFTTGKQSDTVKPVIAKFSPGPEVKGVAVNSPIAVTFSKAMDPSTITKETFFISDDIGIQLSGRLVVDTGKNVATFFPDDSKPNTRYHIVINTQVKDLAGNVLDVGAPNPLHSANEAWSYFETGTP